MQKKKNQQRLRVGYIQNASKYVCAQAQNKPAKRLYVLDRDLNYIQKRLLQSEKKKKRAKKVAARHGLKPPLPSISSSTP
jgi:hypothetical protein